MTRDELAAMAMQGLLAAGSDFWDEQMREAAAATGVTFREAIAHNAYDLAEEMESERARRAAPPSSQEAPAAPDLRGQGDVPLDFTCSTCKRPAHGDDDCEVGYPGDPRTLIAPAAEPGDEVRCPNCGSLADRNPRLPAYATCRLASCSKTFTVPAAPRGLDDARGRNERAGCGHMTYVPNGAPVPIRCGGDHCALPEKGP